jgi:DNA mismatch endonuclease (patch repair protein)
MTDIVSKEKRSRVMAAVKSRGNRSTELKLIKILRKFHVSGWRRNQPLFGKPDFVFKQERVVVFVDGCFWHGCPTCYRRPKSSREYWDNKVQGNIERGKKVDANLSQDGWTVVRIWEHELSDPEKVKDRIVCFLQAK